MHIVIHGENPILAQLLEICVSLLASMAVGTKFTLVGGGGLKQGAKKASIDGFEFGRNHFRSHIGCLAHQYGMKVIANLSIIFFPLLSMRWICS